MATEQEQLSQLQNDMVDVKVRLGVAESDIKVIKTDLNTIKQGISKLLWGVFGIFSTLLVTGVIALINYFLTHH